VEWFTKSKLKCQSFDSPAQIIGLGAAEGVNEKKGSLDPDVV
jgi:hypothetical protein